MHNIFKKLIVYLLATTSLLAGDYVPQGYNTNDGTLKYPMTSASYGPVLTLEPTNTAYTGYYGLQDNGFNIRGTNDVDKWVTWGDSILKWAIGTYRTENGKILWWNV